MAADRCPPCRKLSLILDKVVLEHQGKVLVGRINVDKSSKLAASEGASSIPDVRIYREGKLVDKFVGCPEENDVRERIAAQVKGLPELPKKAGDSVTKPMAKDWVPSGLKRR